MNCKEFVTPFGLFSTIVVTIVGVGIFSYPRELSAIVGNEGWIVSILGGFVSYILIYIAYRSLKANNYDKLYSILRRKFGRIIGSILALLFIVYNVFSAAIGMRIFIEVIKMYLLERTPTEFLIIITILVGSYLLRGEVDTLVKFNEISFWIMFIPIIFVLLFTLNRTDFTNILPVFNNEPIQYIKAISTTIFSFGGIGIIYLLLPFMKDKKAINRASAKAISFVTTFYTIIVVFTLAVFSKEQTKVLLWPTITMIKSINIPGTFIERWEGVVMALWIIFYFTTFVNTYYLSADILKDMFVLNDVKLSSILIVPFVYLIALYPENIAELYDINSKIAPLLMLYALVVLPLILFFRRSSAGRVKEGEINK